MSERNCKYVSSRGILKSCDIFTSSLKSDTHVLDKVYMEKTSYAYGSSIYVCTSVLHLFVQHALPNYSIPFVLVTGDSDCTVYQTDFANVLLNSPLVLHWFAQNCDIKHPKVTSMPIGLDYHTFANKWSPLDQERQLIECSKNTDKKNLCFGNYHFFLHRGNRTEAYNTINKDLCHYIPNYIERDEMWKLQSEYKYTISPLGGGLDCHRTWETLCLGSIPIVQTSPLDILYEGLPVIIVKEWSDITKELLDNYEIPSNCNMDKITLNYWMEKIESFRNYTYSNNNQKQYIRGPVKSIRNIFSK